MRKKVDGRKKYMMLPEFASFIVPALIVALSYLQLSIYPGGKSLVLTYDLRAQLLPLYGYLSNGGISGYDSIFHSMSGGLGGNFFGSLALYISPFDFVYTLIPVEYLPDAVYFMIIAKIGLCGLAMSVFLHRNDQCTLKPFLIVLFSSCYALMSYNIMYSMSPMWYDSVMCLPILAMFLDRIIRGKKSLPFILFFSFCIISDYYMAYMVAMALIIYCVFRLIEEDYSISDFFKRFSLFAIHGIISAGISLIVIIPVLYDFRRGKFLEEEISGGGTFIKNSILDVLKSFIPQSYSGLDYDASPNIFCGSIILILSTVWLFYGKKNIKARLMGLFVIVLYFLSFIFGPLDRVWHGFRDPVCFSCRYSFTFVFFLICFALRGLGLFDQIKKKSSIWGLMTCILFIYSFLEIYINCSYILSRISTDTKYTSRDEFLRFYNAADSLIPYDELSNDSSYGRLVTNYNFTRYDGSLFGYDGLASFTSSYNYSLNQFFSDLGVGVNYNHLTETGLTPPVLNLINSKYIISYSDDLSDQYELIDSYNNYELYYNPNSLTFAFQVPSTDTYSDFSENPFDNINTVYGDLFKGSDEQESVFRRQNIVNIGQQHMIDVSEDIHNMYVSYTFTPENNGYYFLFSEYLPDHGPDYVSQIDDDTYGANTRFIRNCYLNGNFVDEYSDGLYGYIINLGNLSRDKEYTLTLESSGNEFGNTWVYYLDEEILSSIVNIIKSYELRTIGHDGIVLSGDSTGDSMIFVSLPFEDGYRIYVDGKQQDYLSYRNSFVTIPVSSGSHEVRIKFVPPGLKLGVILSIVSFLFGIVFLYYDHFIPLKHIND